jgi:hypothetical protein
VKAKPIIGRAVVTEVGSKVNVSVTVAVPAAGMESVPAAVARTR